MGSSFCGNDEGGSGKDNFHVTPAQAGGQGAAVFWVPAFAGMTEGRSGKDNFHVTPAQAGGPGCCGLLGSRFRGNDERREREGRKEGVAGMPGSGGHAREWRTCPGVADMPGK